MAIMTCESCQTVFEGRPNRKYCSIDCRRKAEIKERGIKRKARYDAWLASLSPKERAFWDSMPTLEEIMAEKLPEKGQKRREV